MKVVTKVPGKLFLAGEYAVVESGNPAVIAAVDLYLTVSIESAESGMIHSTQQSGMEVVKMKNNLRGCRRPRPKVTRTTIP